MRLLNQLLRLIVTAVWGKERAKQAGVVLAAVVAAKALPPDPAGLYTPEGPTVQQQVDEALDGTGFSATVSDGTVTVTGDYKGTSISASSPIPSSGIVAWVKQEVDRLKEVASGP